MASTNTLCKKLLNVNKAVVTGQDFYTDADGVNHIKIYARPNAWHEHVETDRDKGNENVTKKEAFQYKLCTGTVY